MKPCKHGAKSFELVPVDANGLLGTTPLHFYGTGKKRGAFDTGLRRVAPNAEDAQDMAYPRVLT